MCGGKSGFDHLIFALRVGSSAEEDHDEFLVFVLCFDKLTWMQL